MVEDRRFSFALDRARAEAGGQVVEHELDMNREGRRETVLFTRISQLIRWLMPQSARVGPPMRSIARELEERFPSRDN